MDQFGLFQTSRARARKLLQPSLFPKLERSTPRPIFDSNLLYLVHHQDTDQYYGMITGTEDVDDDHAWVGRLNRNWFTFQISFFPSRGFVCVGGKVEVQWYGL